MSVVKVRRIGAMAAAIALAGMIGGVHGALAADPTSYTESTSFIYPAGQRTGYALDLDGDYAVFSQARGSSVTVAHFTGPAQEDWEQTTIAAPAGVTQFGMGAALESGTAVITGEVAGAHNLYIYDLSGANEWTLRQSLTLPAPPAGDTIGGFGPILEMDDGLVAVGAPNSHIGGVTQAGAVYLANVDTETITRVTASTPVYRSIFGETVAINDGYLAVAAPQINGTYGTDLGTTDFRLGRVYLLPLADIEAGTQTERIIDYPVTPKTYPAGAQSVIPFGVSLALEGGVLYSAAPGEVNYTADDRNDPVGGVNNSSVIDGTSTQGAIYAFDVTTGTQVGDKLVPPAHSFGFGTKLAVDDAAVVVSSYKMDPAAPAQGEVYVYDQDDLDGNAGDPAVLGRQQPTPVQMLRPADTPNNSYFGSSIAGFGGGISMSGTRLLVGSPTMGATGTAFIFDPITPNAVVRTLSLEAPAITYGQVSVLSGTTDEVGEDGGTVEFAVDGQTSTPLDVSGHFVEWHLPAVQLGAGSYPVTATFTPTEPAAGEVVAEVTHVVNQATTTTGLTADSVKVAPGAAVVLSGTVVGQFGTVPTGAVQINRAGETLATVTLDASGSYSSAIVAGKTGTESIQVAYLGDANHLVSDNAVSVEIAGQGPGPSTSPTSLPWTTATPSPQPSTPGELPLARTGATVLWSGGVAAALLAVGLGAVWLVKRRS